jgi:hypothetical protein
MAQRIKKQAIWANREKIQKRKLSRIEKSVHIRPLLLIACEGTQTEPNYLNSYLYELIRKGVLSARSYVIAPHSHTDPCGVLNDLLSFKKDGLKYSDYERKWIFIDRDEMRTNECSGHPKDNFNTALSLAEQHQVKVAWSNPCFEFWFLLHFVYHNTPIDRAELPEKLSSFTGIEYKKNCLKM